MLTFIIFMIVFSPLILFFLLLLISYKAEKDGSPINWNNKYDGVYFQNPHRVKSGFARKNFLK